MPCLRDDAAFGDAQAFFFDAFQTLFQQLMLVLIDQIFKPVGYGAIDSIHSKRFARLGVLSKRRIIKAGDWFVVIGLHGGRDFIVLLGKIDGKVNNSLFFIRKSRIKNAG